MSVQQPVEDPVAGRAEVWQQMDPVDDEEEQVTGGPSSRLVGEQTHVDGVEHAAPVRGPTDEVEDRDQDGVDGDAAQGDAGFWEDLQ